MDFLQLERTCITCHTECGRVYRLT